MFTHDQEVYTGYMVVHSKQKSFIKNNKHQFTDRRGLRL